MKNRILILGLLLLSFVGVGQTRTVSGNAIRKEITPKFVNGLIKQYSIAKLRQLRPSANDSSTVYYSTDAGKEGLWKVKVGSSEADNLGTVLVCANGMRLGRVIENGEVFPEWFGAIGDGVTDDTQAIKSFISFTKLGLVHTFRYNYLYYLTNLSDVLHLQSNQKIKICGTFTYVGFGLPLFSIISKNNISLEMSTLGKIEYDGQSTIVLPTKTQTFISTHLNFAGQSYPARDAITSIFISNASEISVKGFRFFSKSEVLDRILYKAISVSYSNKINLENLYMDCVSWSILGWGISDVSIKDIHQRASGQLDTRVYTWDAPSHVIYITTLSTNNNIRIENVIDEGIDVTNSYNDGQTTIKVFATNSHISNVQSRRKYGILDFGGDDSIVENIYWSSDGSDADIRLAKAFRTLNLSTNRCIFRNINLHSPTNSPTQEICVLFQSPCVNSIIDISIIRNSPFINSAPLCLLTDMSKSVFRLNLTATAVATFNYPVAVRLDGICENNDINVKINDPFNYNRSVTYRVLSQVSNLSINNNIQVLESNGDVSNTGVGAIATKSVSIALSGAGKYLKANNVLPMGAIILSISTRVRNSVNTSFGYSVGYTDNSSEFGTTNSRVIGTTTKNSNWSLSAVPFISSSSMSSISITALTTDFDSNDIIDLKITYVNTYIGNSF